MNDRKTLKKPFVVLPQHCIGEIFGFLMSVVRIVKKDPAQLKLEDLIYVGDISDFRMQSNIFTVTMMGKTIMISGESREQNAWGEHDFISRHVAVPKNFENVTAILHKLDGDRIYIYKSDQETIPAADQLSGSNTGK